GNRRAGDPADGSLIVGSAHARNASVGKLARRGAERVESLPPGQPRCCPQLLDRADRVKDWNHAHLGRRSATQVGDGLPVLCPVRAVGPNRIELSQRGHQYPPSTTAAFSNDSTGATAVTESPTGEPVGGRTRIAVSRSRLLGNSAFLLTW